MIDHVLGRPSTSWKRTQVVLVLLFWSWRIRAGDPRGPIGLRSFNNRLADGRFTPWQLVVSALTVLYAVRHWDTLLGLGAPEPLARLYSRGFYRATWINTALDAGFATAAPIRIKWIRDLASMIFSGFYLAFADQADEKLRKFRAVPTVESMRVTWEKTRNPYIQFFTKHDRPKLPIRRKLLLPRPEGSKYNKPIVCWLWFAGDEEELIGCKELIFDIPGGGFIAMSPLSHEERIVRWAQKTRRPILSLDYCKSPEYPFPWALDECVDAYRLLHETKGRILGMGRESVDVVLTGDSAGANLAAAMLITILESAPSSPLKGLPLPVACLYLYPSLDFNFTSWMPSENLKLLRRDKSSAALPESVVEAKSHLAHRSPLSVVSDLPPVGDSSSRSPSQKRGKPGLNLSRSFKKLPRVVSTWSQAITPKEEQTSILDKAAVDRSDEEEEEIGMNSAEGSDSGMARQMSLGERVVAHPDDEEAVLDAGEETDGGAVSAAPSEAGYESSRARARSNSRSKKGKKKAFGTHLTMTSRTSYFNDRIISPSMMRSMAICYIGPRNADRDLTKDYYISPIFCPNHILARFPPVYLICGEKDPFVDDTILFAGKLKEAKRARRAEAQTAGRGRFGEGLRMSSGSDKQDSIVDETEEDWVQTRIFEGWSHGFGLMTALLPEAWSALDLCAGFINTGFQKYRSKTAPPVVSNGSAKQPGVPRSALQTPSKSRTAEKGDEPLSFTPRRRVTRGDSRPASPSPALIAPRVPSGASVTPGLTSDDQATSSSPTSPDTPAASPGQDRGVPGYRVSSPSRKANAAAAIGAIVPPLPSNSAARSTPKPAAKEGTMLDSQAMLDRRRDEAGYGIPVVSSPEERFKRLPDLAIPEAHDSKNASDEKLKSAYVGEDDIYQRRREEAVFGLPGTDHDDGH